MGTGYSSESATHFKQLPVKQILFSPMDFLRKYSENKLLSKLSRGLHYFFNDLNHLNSSVHYKRHILSQYHGWIVPLSCNNKK